MCIFQAACPVFRGTVQSKISAENRAGGMIRENIVPVNTLPRYREYLFWTANGKRRQVGQLLVGMRAVRNPAFAKYISLRHKDTMFPWFRIGLLQIAACYIAKYRGFRGSESDSCKDFTSETLQ